MRALGGSIAVSCSGVGAAHPFLASGKQRGAYDGRSRLADWMKNLSVAAASLSRATFRNRDHSQRMTTPAPA